MMLPRVKGDLIRNLGDQMTDRNYVNRLEQDIWRENPDLAQVCSTSVDVLNEIDGMTTEQLQIAQGVARTTYLMMYNALKQQQICDDLNG